MSGSMRTTLLVVPSQDIICLLYTSTIAYKEGLQRTNVNVFLNYEPFCSFEDVYIANSLNNFILTLNSGFYYGVADNSLDYSSEILGQIITFEKGNGGDTYNKLTYSLPSTSHVNKDKLNTIDLYMFTYDDGVEIDFTRAINGNPAHPELCLLYTSTQSPRPGKQT